MPAKDHASSSSSSKKRPATKDANGSSKKHSKTSHGSRNGSGSRQGIMRWRGDEAVGRNNGGEEIKAVLVDSPSFEPPKSLSLFHFPSSASSSQSQPHTEDSLVLGTRPSHAPNVVIDSTNWNLAGIHPAAKTEIAQAKGYAGSYMLAVYDSQTSQVTLHAAPVLNLTRYIAAADGSSTSAKIQGGPNYALQRRDLGESFGNRKQKLAIRNADRMKVDTTGMDEGVLQGLTESLEESAARSAAAGPSSSTTDGEHPAPSDLASRPIPTPHLSASTPDAVYPLSEIFPSHLSSCINPHPYLNANDISHVKRLLPSPIFRSNWLANRIWLRVLSHRRSVATEDGNAPTGILKTSKSHQNQQTKMLIYLGYLMSLRVLAQQTRSKIFGDRKGLKEKLKLVPRSSNSNDEAGTEDATSASSSSGPRNASAETLLDSLLPLFTTRDRASKKLHMTPFLETKLLATIVVLALHIDGFQLADVEVLSSEMGLNPNKVKDVAKSVGCVTKWRAATTDAAGDGAATAGKTKKVLVLKCPVKLPEPGKGGGPPRR